MNAALGGAILLNFRYGALEAALEVIGIGAVGILNWFGLDLTKALSNP